MLLLIQVSQVEFSCRRYAQVQMNRRMAMRKLWKLNRNDCSEQVECHDRLKSRQKLAGVTMVAKCGLRKQVLGAGDECAAG